MKYRTPVILLTDGYLANGAEPWKLPDIDALPDISVPFATEPNHGDEFWPYLRDPETLARPWAIPGTPGLMHRIGGLEKEDGTGNVSYEPENHEKMTRLRAAKIAGIAKRHPRRRPRRRGRRRRSCSARGAARGAWRPRRCAASAPAASPIAHAHLTHLNPFPADLGDVLRRYRPGPRARAQPRASCRSCCGPSTSSTRRASPRCRAVPFKAAEVEAKILELMNAVSDENGNGERRA